MWVIRALVPLSCLLATGCSLLFSEGGGGNGAGPSDAAVVEYDAGMQISLIPSAAEFQSVVVGTPSATVFFSAIALSDTAPLTTRVSNADTLTIEDDCQGKQLLRGEFCVYEMTFTPSSNTVFGGLLDIGGARAPWGGLGLLPGDAVASAAALDFGESIVQNPSKSLDLTISNVGEAEIHPDFEIVGEGGAGYTFEAFNCGTIAAGEGTCTVSITYSHASVGTHLASFEVDLDGVVSYAVSLVGATRNPILTVEVPAEGAVLENAQGLGCQGPNASCAWPISFGTEVTLVPAKLQLQSWIGGEDCELTDSEFGQTCTLVIDSDRSITAMF